MHPWNDPGHTVAERVDALLAELTLEEKIGQLGSYWSRTGSHGGGSGTDPVASQVASEEPAEPTGDRPGAGDEVAPMQAVFDAARKGLDKTAEHGLGQLTRVFGTAPVTAADGVRRLADLQQQVTARSRLGIPAIAHEECLTGFTTLGATVYPAAIAWGATFDPELIEQMAAAIGSDLAAVGVHQGLSPLLDVVRDYRWGRVEETIGEDPYLVGTLGTAYVKGLQSAGVIATLKHFCGYSASRAGRNHAPVPMGRREFGDVLLPSFEMAVRLGGVRSVMNSYSDVDGVPVAADHDLLTRTLRDHWGFSGTVVSDYWSIPFLQTMHRVAADSTEAGGLALAAGLDVELPETSAYADLAKAIGSGLITEQTVDTAVRRVLTHKIELGLLDPDWQPVADGDGIDLDSDHNRGLARRVAEESITLLANDGVLPVRPDHGSTIAVIGPVADDVRTFFGCYSFPNHVLSRAGSTDIGLPADDLVGAMTAEFVDAQVRHAQGVPILEADSTGIDEATRLVGDSDLVVLAVGDRAGMFGTGTSGEGCDSVDLSLPGLQGRLAEAVLDAAEAAGSAVILVVVSGRPYALGGLAERCAAVVQAFMPGVEGGSAIAGVLSGRINPSGRLPIGIPDHPGGQPGSYLAPPLGWYSDGVSNLDPRPLYPFGHGLSYTSFDLVDLELSTEQINTDGAVEVSATVINSGDRAGAEVVQLYAGDPVARVARPLKQLIGFAKVALQPGEAARVRFTVDADRFSYLGPGPVGPDYRRIVDPGVIELSIGRSSEDRPLQAELMITGAVREVGDGRVLDTPVAVTTVR
ncbi:glycoside hydrolase family 3 N-terminal domain-containing protein [Microlunatus soli]|uniref:Beta-glucosidase n=1 Tax=Microlunatus soli TaxID=630515 RepID=A0A1H2A1N9_9ACTN|nr:glycoside hydrolase family 3 N-terminal domain-containing protein [Microlunatus soli]SDT39406.1 beta-glucosidase [Microlunatus soli]